MNKFSIESVVVPHASRIFIRKQEKETRTASGLFLPEEPDYQKKDNLGMIVAIGNETTDENTQVGALIAYDGSVEMNLPVEGVEYAVIFEKQIICYFRKEQ